MDESTIDEGNPFLDEILLTIRQEQEIYQEQEISDDV